MNKIYKVVKNNATGSFVAVSELARGVKKGNKLKLASLVLFGALSSQAFAADSIPQDYNPTNNNQQAGKITVTGSGQSIDLGLNNGFNSTDHGKEVTKHTVSTEVQFDALYKTKYTDVTNATNNFNSVQQQFNKGNATQEQLDAAQSQLDAAKAASAAISDDKLKVSGNTNLIGSEKDVVTISHKDVKYKDPVTDKSFVITVVDKLTSPSNNNEADGNLSVIFYEKQSDDSQYNDMQMVQVQGSGTDATIVNTGDSANGVLNAISKNGTGVISVEDGANLTIDTNISYYLGSEGQSRSTEFVDKDVYTVTQSFSTISYNGTVETAIGTRTINNEDDFKAFNKELIKYIQTNEKLRLNYSTVEEMQEFYDSQIRNVYTAGGADSSYSITYSIDRAELEEIINQDPELKAAYENRVTSDDSDDIGLKTTNNNHLIGVKGSGSEITLTEGNTIKNYDNQNNSSGSIIRADFDESGSTANNIFNINGKLDANGGSAIKAKNAEIIISETGNINGSISLLGTGNATGNLIDNKGQITGSITTENVTLNNSGRIDGSISAGQNAKITNKENAIINGGITAQNNSTIVNENGALIGGVVVVRGEGASFDNKGTVGGAFAFDGATVSNNNLFLGSSNIVSLGNGSALNNNGDIYIGYSSVDLENETAVVGSANTTKYTAMQVSGAGTVFNNNHNVFLSSSQSNVTVISVANSGKYIDDKDAKIVLNKENQTITGVDKDTGNNNTAIYVTGTGTDATINGTITLNDVGSTGVWIQNGGSSTLSGIVNLNGQNGVGETQVRSFGAWVQGDGTTFTMNGNAQINMNSERAIGVHIRDGAKAEINDHASITFSDKKNQIGFLISGISKAAAIEYNSDELLKLQGDGSVLFRVERGSIFNSSTISSTNPSLSVLDSNNTKDSTLIVITNGPTATGASNQTNADLSGFTLKVNGENAKGISVEGGANVKITGDTQIQLTGDNSILAKIDGNYYDLNGVNAPANNGKSYLESSAQLTTDLTGGSDQIVTGQDSVGYYITNGGTLDHKGSIDFKEPSKNNIGVKIDSGGTLISELGSYVKVRGTAIEISGSSSVATVNNIGNGDNPVVWAIGADGNQSDSAYHVKDQATLKLTGTGITRAQGTAHGILVNGASQIVLDSATLDLFGDGTTTFSTGNGIENRSALSNIQFINGAKIDVKDGYGIHSSVGFSQSVGSLTAGTINVFGQGTGIRFENIDPLSGDVLGTTNNSINNTGYEKVVINVYENTGHGIYVDSSKNVNTSASVNIISNTGHSALEIKGSTSTASQSGNLHSANKNDVIVDLNNGSMTKFTNNGELLFGDFTKNSTDGYDFTAQDKNSAKDSYAIKTGATENGLDFTNDTKGNINGTVELLGYGDSTDPEDKTKGNTVTLRGEGNIFITGDGNDKFVVDKVVGDDLGGENQVKQFTQLDGGEGDDEITFNNNSDFTINKDDTIKNIEYFALNNASKVTLNNLATVDGLNSAVTTYDIIDSASVLTYRWNQSNTDFNRLLKGNGTFKVDLQNLDSQGKPSNSFAFDSTTNSGDFTGTLELTNTQYTLADSSENNNTSALTQATLKASDNSYIEVGSGDQNIKGLYVSGGTVDFGRINIGDDKSVNHVVVDNLVLDKGNIQIDVSGSIYNPGIPSSLPLLEQDNGVIFTKLVSANNVSGGAVNIDIDRTQIKLVDENGTEIIDPAQSNLVQNGEIVARATYDTRLTKGQDSDGLYVGYGLTQVELKAQNNADGIGNALILDASDSDPSKAGSSDFDVLITDYDNGDGTYTYGDLQIRGTKAVTLSGSNTYHGSTFVKDTSSLIAGANNALGATRLLKLDENTQFSLNGWTQELGSLYTSNQSSVNLDGGTLTISGKDVPNQLGNLSSYIAAGSLSGSGKFVVGDTSLTRTLTGNPTVTITSDNNDLTADIINATNGQINMDSQGGLGTGKLTNNGILNLYFSEDSVLTNSTLDGYGSLNKYNSGTLTLSLSQAKDFNGETNINGGAIIFKGDSNATSDSYATSRVNIASNGALIGLDNVIFQGDINNSGRFYIGDLPNSTTVNESTVTVNNYTGNADSYLIFNGKLSDDSSPMSKLIINGDATGTSYVSVNNIGGLGAKTINGISIIDVNGQSDAEFVQSGRIIAGAYDYKLQRSQSNTNNWVLISDLTARPEVGSYLGNIYSANTMFNLRLHDRLGETQYTDLLTGEQKTTSMWLRYQYGYNKFDAANGDLTVKDNWNITQLGGDIAGWSSNGLNRLHIGLMVGQGHSSTKSHSNIDSAKSEGKLNGYSYGLYATWYDNNEDKTGLYVDSWALWNNFSASVSGDSFSEKYRLKGLTASVESGYSFVTGTLGNYDVWLQPKAQLLWSGVKSKDITESNGTHVSFNKGNLQTRLGFRASLLSNHNMQLQTNQSAQLFVEANWLHNTKLYEVTLNNEMTVGQDGARNIGEVKVGIEGNISTNTNIWFNVAGQRGDHSYQNASAMLGLKYSF